MALLRLLFVWGRLVFYLVSPFRLGASASGPLYRGYLVGGFLLLMLRGCFCVCSFWHAWILLMSPDPVQ